MARPRIGAWVLIGVAGGLALLFLGVAMTRRGVQVGAGTEPNEDGLVVSLSPLGSGGFGNERPSVRGASFAPIPSVFHNPLFGEAVEVRLENVSDKSVGILIYDDVTPFFVETRIEPCAPAPAAFPRMPQSVNNLKHIISSDFHPTRSLRPGESLSVGQVIDMGWLDRFDGLLSPGRYTVQVVCSYYRMPGFKVVEIKAAPMVVTVTTADIQEWRLARAVAGLLGRGRRARDRMDRLFGGVIGPIHNALPMLSFRR